MFGFGTSLASIYDYIYLWKDYRKEAHIVTKNLRDLECAEGVLLELACGTGRHLEYFSNYEMTGVDLCEESLMLASFRAPQASFLRRDMRHVHPLISDKVDVLLMLFGAVSYISPQDLVVFFKSCAELMTDRSVLVLEPWYEDVQEGGFLQVYDSKELKICRLSDIQRASRQTIMDFSFVISRAGHKVERLRSRECLWNHVHEDLLIQLELAGLQCVRKVEGFTGMEGMWFLRKCTVSSMSRA